MTEENMNEWKYPKLINYAKELGIVFETQKPKKSIVVEAIEAHLRINQQQVEPEQPAVEEKKAAKKTRGRPKSKAPQAEPTPAPEAEPTPEPEVVEEKPKKAKKKTSKAKKSEPPVEDVTTSRRSARASSVAKDPATPKNQVPSAVVNALTKSIHRNKAHQIAVPQVDAPVETKSKAGRKKKSSKGATVDAEAEVPKKGKKSAAKKSAHNETFSAAQVLESIVDEIPITKTPRKSQAPVQAPQSEEKDTSGKDIQLRLDEDTNEAAPLPAVTAVKHKMTESALLTEDEDEPAVKSRRTTPAKTARSPRAVSVDSRLTNKLLNITNDVISTTFSKTPSKEGVPCASFYHNAAAESAAPVIAIQPPISEPQGVTKPAGGARIVRPKQLVSQAQDMVVVATAASDETASKKMEIVQREAGPRIVKPKVLAENEAVESKSGSKTKKRVVSADHVALKSLRVPQKTDSPKVPLVRKRSPVPDFKAIHEKQAQKMQSLDDYVQKKQERQAMLLNKPTTGTEPQSKLKTPKALVVKATATLKPKTPLARLQAKTPNSGKPAKTPGSSKPVLKASNQPNVAASVEKETSKAKKPKTNIPRLNLAPKPAVNDENKPQVTDENAATPVMANRRVSAFNSATKTPGSTCKPSLASLNQSATKKADSFVFGGANAPSASALLATSSFNRRKSYDLNASLAKPLGYNPHVGKLKPIDFNAKSIFLAGLKDSGRPGTGTVAASTTADTTVLIDKTSSTPKAGAQAQAKRRQSNILLSSIRPVSTVSITGKSQPADVVGSKTHLLQQAVRLHSKEKTDKFRLNENKIRQEQRLNTVSKNRQIETK